MKCDPLIVDGRTVGYVCGRGRARSKPCYVCGEASHLLCDGKFMEEGRKWTCDKAICPKHATHEGKDRDYCPECMARRKPQAKETR